MLKSVTLVTDGSYIHWRESGNTWEPSRSELDIMRQGKKTERAEHNDDCQNKTESTVFVYKMYRNVPRTIEVSQLWHHLLHCKCKVKLKMSLLVFSNIFLSINMCESDSWIYNGSSSLNRNFGGGKAHECVGLIALSVLDCTLLL